MNNQELESRQVDEQRVIEAKILKRAQRQNPGTSSPASGTANQQQASTTTTTTTTTTAVPIPSPPTATPPATSTTENSDGHAFGSSLENDPRIRRVRAPSDEDFRLAVTGQVAPESELQLLRQLSLTSHDRQALEAEMRQQHTHPLALQLEAEAEERRLHNQLEYQRTHPQRPPHFRGNSGRRGWRPNGFGGTGSEVNSLDDLVVLEAAILLSMEEEERRRTAGGNNNDTNNTSNDAGTTTRTGGPSGAVPPMTVSQHAMQGMPIMNELRRGLSRGDSISSLGQRFRRNRSVGGAVMESANLLLSGVTEDEQVAMAIALSMQADKEKEEEGEKDKDGDDATNDQGRNKPKVSRRGQPKSEAADDYNTGNTDGNRAGDNHDDDDENDTGGFNRSQHSNKELDRSGHQAAGVASLPPESAPLRSAVASLPQKLEPVTPYASLPAKAGGGYDDDDYDDDYDDSKLGIVGRLVRQTKKNEFYVRGKTTGDDVIETNLPNVKEDEMMMPTEQAVVVMKSDGAGDR